MSVVVSPRPVPPTQRRIPIVALQARRAGEFLVVQLGQGLDRLPQQAGAHLAAGDLAAQQGVVAIVRWLRFRGHFGVR